MVLLETVWRKCFTRSVGLAVELEREISSRFGVSACIDIIGSNRFLENEQSVPGCPFQVLYGKPAVEKILGKGFDKDFALWRKRLKNKWKYKHPDAESKRNHLRRIRKG